jgi:hypothetical protein
VATVFLSVWSGSDLVAFITVGQIIVDAFITASEITDVLSIDYEPTATSPFALFGRFWQANCASSSSSSGGLMAVACASEPIITVQDW